ncbi:hypothetical protein [Lacticaseibacillus mingshuiensis]|uniref:DUF5067 domain-containing protein n=2 Tax=Lacticaseibacillus mingshuiensis TaxID=2799574 RepID=A0ABW4CEZ0_9LACO|nr:hypothetical protein [Lacticaseibacillus mingshuiensis]
MTKHLASDRSSRHQCWQRMNMGLAIIALVLALIAVGRFGWGYWADQSGSSKPVVVRAPAVTAERDTGVGLSLIKFSVGRDWLKRPALVIHYEIQNDDATALLPQYYFARTVVFRQLSPGRSTVVLARTTLPSKQLSALERNLAENSTIMLRHGETVTVLEAVRLESLDQPVTVAVAGRPAQVIKPWQLKEVADDGKK